MKKIFSLFYIIIIVGAGFSLSESDFENVVDFSITLKDLDKTLDDASSNIPYLDKFIIINGLLSYISIINEDPDNYIVEIELTRGEWIGLEEVESYHVIVRFKGSAFEKYFNRRGSEKIALNTHLIVVAKIAHPITNLDGEKIWLLEGIDLRAIK